MRDVQLFTLGFLALAAPLVYLAATRRAGGRR